MGLYTYVIETGPEVGKLELIFLMEGIGYVRQGDSILAEWTYLVYFIVRKFKANKSMLWTCEIPELSAAAREHFSDN